MMKKKKKKKKKKEFTTFDDNRGRIPEHILLFELTFPTM